MSQFGSNKVETIFTTDTTQVAPAVDAASRKVDEFKNKGEKGGEGFAQGIKKSIGAVTSFIGAMTAAVGVATTFFILGTKIRDVYDHFFTSATEKAAKFVAAIDATEAKSSLAKIEAEILQLQGRLGKSLEIGGDGKNKKLASLLIGDPDDLKGQIAALEKTALAFRKQLRAPLERAKDAEQDNDIERRRELELDAALSDLEARGREKIAAEKAFQFELELNEKMKQSDAELFEAREKYHRDELKRIAERTEREVEGAQRILDELRALNEERERGLGLEQASVLGISRDSELINIIGRRVGR